MSGSPLLYIVCFVALVNLVLAVVLWRQIKALDRRLRQTSATNQRHDREISQQRYALAMLRQMQQEATNEASEHESKTDEQLLDSAMGQLDKASAAVVPSTPDVAIAGLKDDEILQFVKKAIKNNEVAISRQPIVTLPKREMKYYEIFSRILVGDQGYIPAHKFISIAQGHNLMGVLDNLLLLRCLQLIKQNANKDQSVGFFVNISSQTLNNKTYIMDLIEFLQANPKLSSRLIFEITQQDSLKLSAMTKSVMEGLALLGCRFSMDQVTIFGMDVDRLVDHNISFVKMDTRALGKEMDDPNGRGRMKRIKNGLDAQGIQVIAEKIEDEKQLMGIMDLYVDFGQGYLFGQPELMV